MRIITLGAAHRNFSRPFAENVFDRRRFGVVVELRGAGVRVDVIDLFGRKLCVSQSVAYGAGA